MNPTSALGIGSYRPFNHHAIGGIVALSLLFPLSVPGGGVVTECTEANLRAAMVGGGTVTFACDGTITVGSTITNLEDTILDGTGHQVTISGNNAVRAFYVSTNTGFSVVNLTIADGRSTNGAGIFNDGAVVTLFGATFRSNVAYTVSSFPQGGALLNRGGTVSATDCTFSGNSALRTNACSEVSPARGGAVGNESGVVTLANCLFTANGAHGAPGAQTSTNGLAGQAGCGGAVDNSGVVNIIDCSFLGNSAIGGEGGPGASTPYSWGVLGGGGGGAPGVGGAVCNSGLLTMSGCALVSNSATGGVGGSGGSRYFMSTFPVDGAGGGAGGFGNGGALFNGGVARLINCTLGLNTGTGASGGPGGAGSMPPTHDYPAGHPGANGIPGSGFGGICDTSGQCHLINCTLAFNSGTGSLSIGGISTGGATMVNTLLAENAPGGNGSSAIVDLGHNLSSDNSCAFTNAGSLNGTYALLGPLTNNGGLTATIALLAGSRAIDAGDTAAAPSTDQRGVARPFGIASDIGAYEYDSLTNPLPSTVVSHCTEADLRAAMTGGGTVTFATDGTITLTNTIIIPTNTTLDATGHQITISGNNSVRVFHVNSNVTFTAVGLIIANGGGGNGAGIFNDGGTLVLLDAVFQTNAANATAGSQGGAVFNRGGFVNGTNCVFMGNQAYLSTPGASARGGAIRNESGEINFHECIFTTNRASGAAGDRGYNYDNATPGGCGWGGAVDNSGTLRLSDCSLTGNSAVGAGGGAGGWIFNGQVAGGSGGSGVGAAVCNFGAMTINRSTFSGNMASGGPGGAGSSGLLTEPGTSGGRGGAGGSGNGGAIFNAGAVQLINSTFVFNSVAGEIGGAGGNGGGARMRFRGGNGGDGGGGGSASGGAICDTNGLCWATNCTLAFNSAINGIGGAGGVGGYGDIPGSPGMSGPPGVTAAGGIRTMGGALVNTLFATNAPGSNCYGRITDAGYNLSSDASCGFTNRGSLNSTDPKLGPLADNGGPTLTMALLPGSPAIDGGDDVAAPATDQRGFPRPVGAAADIGAFEYGSPALLRITRSSETDVEISVLGVKTQWCRLFTSMTLSNWQCVATNQFSANGTVLFQDSCGTGEIQRFYKVVLP